MEQKKITSATVRADFNDPIAVAHYARAAHFLGLWASERLLIERFFPDKTAPLLEAGCGAGRATVGLWHLGYTNLTAFDFAAELVEQARFLAEERGASSIRFLVADATALSSAALQPARKVGEGGPKPRVTVDVFAGALFLFNGLMQIPGRENRRTALCELHRVCAPGAPLLFTSHDRDHSPTERAMWRLETERWVRGQQDPRLVEFGDRYFEDEVGRTFMHLPDRREILEDLAATGWRHAFDALRTEVARESKAVRDFSDECRFWLAQKM
ncbi:MAG: class I SAM-dependent methyltransferase [Verrucomicrobia bacterium]|nr:class I SAM-dependent methyltransferase [Verrucomicrobiota bacterium]